MLPLLVAAGASLAGSMMASRSAKKASAQQAAAMNAQTDVAREQLALERQRDERTQAIVDENNAMLRSRAGVSQDAFNALVRNIGSFKTDTGLAGALSTLEGEGQVARRSLRGAMGGGLDTSRNRALGFAMNRERAQLTNKITSQNLLQKQQMLASIGGPVMLQTPGSLTSGGAANQLGASFGNIGKIYGDQADAFGKTAGQLGQYGTGLLMEAFKADKR